MNGRLGRVLLSAAILLVGGASWACAAEPAGPPASESPIAWRLAVRMACYGKFQQSAWTHLPSIGVHYAFLSVPAPTEMPAVKTRLA